MGEVRLGTQRHPRASLKKPRYFGMEIDTPDKTDTRLTSPPVAKPAPCSLRLDSQAQR